MARPRKRRIMTVCLEGAGSSPALATGIANSLDRNPKAVHSPHVWKNPPHEMTLKGVKDVGDVAIYTRRIASEGKSPQMSMEDFRNADLIVTQEMVDLSSDFYLKHLRGRPGFNEKEFLKLVEEREKQGSLVKDDNVTPTFVKDREAIIRKLKRS